MKLSVCLGTALICGLAGAQVLQNESFETGFSTGELDGQNGWFSLPGDALPFVESGMVTISTQFARSGSKSVKLDATLLFAGESIYAFRPLTTPVPSSSALVLAEFWMRYESSTPGAQFGGASYDSFGGLLGTLQASSQSGAVLASWESGPSTLSANAASWNRISAVHNMSSGQILGYINGQLAYTSSGAFTNSNFSDFDFFAFGNGQSAGFFDDISVERMSLGTVRGRVNLNDYAAPSLGVPVRIRVLNGSGTALQTLNTSLNANGEFSFVAGPRGVHNIEIKPWHWTSKTIVGVNITDNGVFYLQTTHSNGDADQSDEVDAADIDAVIAAFGSTGSPNALITDIDGSGEVDAADIDVVIANFGAVGD